nr:hypothetical protein BgiMline_032916 [Biomphalaria glabrata]
MSIIHRSTRAVRKLAVKGRLGSGRTYTQVSHPVFKLDQNGATLSQPVTRSAGWALPASLALIGLGFSLFSTKQLVSCNGTIKAFAVPNRK